MELKNSKFLKFGTLLCATLCFAFLPFLSLNPTYTHALSTPNTPTNVLDNCIISPYRNMTVTSVGNRRDAGKYGFVDNRNYQIGNSQLFNLLYWGNSTKDIINSNIVSNDALYNYNNNVFTRGGVVTTLDGFVSGDMPYSNNYYDYSGSYVLSQNYNDYNNKLEVNAYNTSSYNLFIANPQTLYCNSSFTNFDLRVGMLTKYAYSGIFNEVLPSYLMEVLRIDTDYSFNDANPNIPNYLNQGYVPFIDYYGYEDNWQSFNMFINLLSNYTNYTVTTIDVGLIDNYGNNVTKTFNYKNYGVMSLDTDTGVYSGRHIIPFNNDLYDFINTNGLMQNYCCMFTKFNVTVTAYCDNGSYYNTNDDYIIDVGNLFLDLPYYNQNVGSGISTSSILSAEEDSMYLFVGDITNDKATFMNFFKDLFDFEIIKGFKLSYLVIFSLGCVLIVIFVRFFR